MATGTSADMVYSMEPELILMKELSPVPMTMVLRNHGMPKDRRMFMVLAPKEFDTPIEPSPGTQ